jgi:hypothetical protein
LHREHFVHVRDLIDAKQQRVEHRERHRDQAQPKRDRGHDGEGDERSAPERAQCVEDVPDRVVDEGAHGQKDAADRKKVHRGMSLGIARPSCHGI